MGGIIRDHLYVFAVALLARIEQDGQEQRALVADSKRFDEVVNTETR